MLNFCTSAAKTVLSAAGAPVRHFVRQVTHRAAVHHVPHLHVHHAAVRAGVPHPGAVAPTCAHAPGNALPAGPGHALVPGPASRPVHGGNGAEYAHAGASNGGASGLGTRPGIGSLGAARAGTATAIGSPLAAGAGLLAGTLALGGLTAAAALAFWSAVPGQQAPIVPAMQLDYAAVAPSLFSMTPSPAAGAGLVAAVPDIAADPGLAWPALQPNTVSVAEPASLALMGVGAAAAVAARHRMRRR